MFLLKDDIQHLISLGFKEDFFTVEYNGFKSLSNKKGRCVFHDGKECTIYPNRPLGCKLYPVIFDVDLKRPVMDRLCPFREEFSFPFKVRQESSKLYLKLIGEKRANNKEMK